MKKILVSLTSVLLFTAGLLTLAPSASAEGLPLLGAAVAAADESASERDKSYRQGRRALDGERWDEAVRHFDDVVARGGKDADAALYWKAYAHHKADQRGAALAALSELESKHAASRWRDDARALKMEIRDDSASVDSAADDDEELKLLALNSLMNMDSERAVEMLESFLDGDRSQDLQKRALFVLSQNSSARAREILVEIARGGRGQDLQKSAIRYLGMTGGRASDDLAAIYRSTAEAEIKKAVLHAYMLGHDTGKVLDVYRSETDPKLRLAAVHQLGVMHAVGELRALYKSENDAEVRGQILHSMFIGGDAEGLMAIYGSETDPELRKKAVRSLGLTHQKEARGFLVELYGKESSQDVKAGILNALFLSQATSELVRIARAETDQDLKKKAIHSIGLTHQEEGREVLVELYREDQRQDVRKAVLHALFLSQAASELIEIARAETDQELRKDAIRKIGMIHSDEAVEFMMEILEER